MHWCYTLLVEGVPRAASPHIDAFRALAETFSDAGKEVAVRMPGGRVVDIHTALREAASADTLLDVG